MIENKWFCEPNPFREKYCFFYLRTTLDGDQQLINGWKTGIGNIDSIIHRNQFSNVDENQIINSLLPEVKVWRKKNVIVITDTEEKIPILRTRIAALGIDEINLSATRMISLESLFNKYFSCSGDANLQSWCILLNINMQESDEPDMIRIILQKLIRLIPDEEIP